MVASTYSTLTHDVLRMSPNHVLLGIDLRLSGESSQVFASHHLGHLEQLSAKVVYSYVVCSQDIHENLEKSSAKRQSYDAQRIVARVRPVSFVVGDCVLICDNERVKTKHKKLETYWRGPFYMWRHVHSDIYGAKYAV